MRAALRSAVLRCAVLCYAVRAVMCCAALRCVVLAKETTCCCRRRTTRPPPAAPRLAAVAQGRGVPGGGAGRAGAEGRPRHGSLHRCVLRCAARAAHAALHAEPLPARAPAAAPQAASAAPPHHGPPANPSVPGIHYEVIECGLLAPDPFPTGQLLTGQVGYMLVGMKDTRSGAAGGTLCAGLQRGAAPRRAGVVCRAQPASQPPTRTCASTPLPAPAAARVGDTWHHYRKPVPPLPGFKPAKSAVFAGGRMRPACPEPLPLPLPCAAP